MYSWNKDTLAVIFFKSTFPQVHLTTLHSVSYPRTHDFFCLRLSCLSHETVSAAFSFWPSCFPLKSGGNFINFFFPKSPRSFFYVNSSKESQLWKSGRRSGTVKTVPFGDLYHLQTWTSCSLFSFDTSRWVFPYPLARFLKELLISHSRKALVI